MTNQLQWKKGAWVLVLLVTAAACRKNIDQQFYPVMVHIEHKAGSDLLALGSPATTPLGEPITIYALKYYLSNFSVEYADGREELLPETYFLINESEPASKHFSIAVKEGKVKSLRFWIGVDSARNVSGVQTGALDPAHGMFWTWNSGYIFAKLEGRSAISPAALQAVTYHIGGFRTGENALRQVTIPFATELSIDNTNNYTIWLGADVMKWFRGASDVSIATIPATMEPGPLSLQIANNYSRMFVLNSVTH